MPSSVIRSFRYEAPTQTLAITFTSGRRYRYFEVPASLFEAMEAAGSKGGFFNDQIRDRFRYSRDA
jgi:lysyl-tRNA synthetase class 2